MEDPTVYTKLGAIKYLSEALPLVAEQGTWEIAEAIAEDIKAVCSMNTTHVLITESAMSTSGVIVEEWKEEE